MEIRELLSKAQTNSGASSQRELAKIMNLNNSSLSLLASGKGELSDDTYVKLAKLAGVDPVQVLIEKHARKAGPEAAPLWKQIQKHLPKSAAVAVIAVCAMPLIPEKAQAGMAYTNLQVPTINIMRIKISNIHQPYTSSIQIDKSLLSKLTSKLDCR
ncbi:helix-turn-helix domain-containing protein [Acidithiobacillus thiooxidans]|uniref:helix-turn-helix domain-containing protein n=1 Tax=Acidithiobacillus TaxID=119977 RepID=UPI001879EA54|nr:MULTISPECIES: helix-turn-helix domain-containing protein [Acidithiobacillus]MBE7566427.1 helix-turn-helix domain-containing protein [Acidithiobacillus sp. HP-11]MBU2751712.1 helix-turn-helix domain-containing protein [Acidithiobacillus thiooxidans]